MIDRIFYGDPAEPLSTLMPPYQRSTDPPEDGDILCDGHQMHYVWKGGPDGWWDGWIRPEQA